MPTLITIPVSHFCEKARWALDHARVTFQEEGHVPGLHRRAVAVARGKGGSVPVLVLDGTGVLDDSPLIVRWADSRATSDRKLLPSGGRERDEAMALEHHFDVDFAPHVRRFSYFHLLPERETTLKLMAIATPSGEHLLFRAAFPLVRVLMKRTMRIDAHHSSLSRDKLQTVFDEVDRRLADGRPYLMGDHFGALDIAFAAFSSPLLGPAEHPIRKNIQAELPEPIQREGRELAERPSGRFVLRMYREHRAPD